MESLPITLCVNLSAGDSRYEQIISTILSQTSCWSNKIAHLRWSGENEGPFNYGQFKHRDIDYWLQNHQFRVWASHSKTEVGYSPMIGKEIVKLTSDIKTPYVFVMSNEIILPYSQNLNYWVKESINLLEQYSYLTQVGISKDVAKYSQWTSDHENWYWTDEFCSLSVMRTRDWHAAGVFSRLLKTGVESTMKLISDWTLPFIRFNPRMVGSVKI